MERFAYDGIYNFFIVTLIFQIVLGIIIDTFTKLREDEMEKFFDMENKCFICGRLRYEFDKLLDLRSRYPSHI
jgi:hypothetical protein